MSETDLSHYIPRRLDDSGKFLFWDLDVAAVGTLGALAGVAAEMPLLGVIFGVLCAYGYSKFKAGQHPGMAKHLFYWFTGFPALKDLPGSHLREFNG